jgi:muramoyltetrapeptide carboxypeptidase
VRGRLVGGNLRMVAASLGTPWEIDTRGAILFLEEVGEQPYSIDRSLVQLREAGKLGAALGVAVGALVECESERYPETSARDALCEILGGAVDGPIALDLPFGHIADHRALGFGVRAELDGGRGSLSLLEPVVDAGGSA